jgi:ribA/ribD-fused uncharacterized protein
MKMDINSLRDLCASGKEFEYLYFWGSDSCFSQWHDSPFEIDDIIYPTAEHWMMASKARLFGDKKILQEILNTKSPKEAKALGRRVNGFIKEIWEQQARQIVTFGNMAKFQQNLSLKNILLGTGNKVLVEASPFDKIWGIGMGAENEKAKHPSAWDGLNLLGFTLMDVRDKLKSDL